MFPHEVVAPMGTTIPAGTRLVGLTPAQVAARRLVLDIAGEGAKAVATLTAPTQFKRGERVNLADPPSKGLVAAGALEPLAAGAKVAAKKDAAKDPAKDPALV